MWNKENIKGKYDVCFIFLLYHIWGAWDSLRGHPLPLVPSFLMPHTEGERASLLSSPSLELACPPHWATPRVCFSTEWLYHSQLCHPWRPPPVSTPLPQDGPLHVPLPPNTAAHLISPSLIPIPSECFFTFPFTPNWETGWPMDFGVRCQWLKIPVLSPACHMIVGNSFITLCLCFILCRTEVIVYIT